MRDMTKWLKQDKVRIFNEMKSVAYAMCSHEFREPINAIIKNVELLEPYVDFE